jgi:hypothetical protein
MHFSSQERERGEVLHGWWVVKSMFSLEGFLMRHEDATEAIYKVKEWFGGALSKGEHVDAKMSRLIDTILEAYQLSMRMHDHLHAQDASVDLLWKVVGACDIDAIRKAIDEANEIAGDAEERGREVRALST